MRNDATEQVHFIVQNFAVLSSIFMVFFILLHLVFFLFLSMQNYALLHKSLVADKFYALFDFLKGFTADFLFFDH